MVACDEAFDVSLGETAPSASRDEAFGVSLGESALNSADTNSTIELELEIKIV